MRIEFIENDLLEMSNILKRETGLPYNVWIEMYLIIYQD